MTTTARTLFDSLYAACNTLTSTLPQSAQDEALTEFQQLQKPFADKEVTILSSTFTLHTRVFIQAISVFDGQPIAYMTQTLPLTETEAQTPAPISLRFPYRAVVLDIEGTTTSISFVKDVLFPYARKHLAAYAAAHSEEPAFQTLAESIIREAETFQAANPGTNLPQGTALVERLGHAVSLLMDHDVKATGLKALQGSIWKDGYQSGNLQGHLYPDTPLAFNRWTRLGIPIHIYSSGSVPAQKLLFGFSEAGDLTSQLAGHFDTTIGLKIHQSSYEKIRSELGLPASDILFATDNILEAEAARKDGWNCVCMDRPGNARLPENHTFPVASSFVQLFHS